LILIVDSFAWIEFFRAGKHGPRVRHHLETAENLVCPDIVLAEVARKFGRDGMELSTIEGHLRTMGSLSAVRAIDARIALETIRADTDLKRHARLRKLELPGFADAILLGFARALDALVLTGDPHFEGLPETQWMAG
jgi:predicted nucleic acid-binding protein